MMVPADEFIPGSQVEYGVPQREQTDEFLMMLIPNQESQSTAISFGDRYPPVVACESKEIALPCAGANDFNAWTDAFDVKFSPRREVLAQARRSFDDPCAIVFKARVPLMRMHIAVALLVEVGWYQRTVGGLQKPEPLEMSTYLPFEPSLVTRERYDYARFHAISP